MVILVILVIILGLYAWSKKDYANLLEEENKKLKKEIFELKENLKSYSFEKDNKIQDSISKENITNFQKEQEKIQKPEPKVEKYKPTPEEIKIQNELKEKKESEKKNISILVTGAILIVLAAIVFLMSTWEIIPNLFKTSVLVLLVGVFFGASKIAKENFKLENASKAFFYIAMAYIPICLFSISIFSLFGNYFSIYGEGKFIYLTFCGILISIIYYITYKMKDTKVLFYGSILSQMFSVMLFSLIFENDVKLIGINLLLYNIALLLLTGKREENIFEYIYNGIPYIISFFTVFDLWQSSGHIVILLLLITINFIILELKNSKLSYSYIFNIALNVFGLYLINNYKLEFSLPIKQVLSLVYILVVFVLENVLLIKQKNSTNLKKSCTVINLITIGILHMDSFNLEVYILKPYVIALVELVMLMIAYIKSKGIGKEITSYLIPIYFIIAGLNFISSFDGNYQYYIIFALITFVISQTIRGKEVLKLNKAWFTISHIFVLLTYLIVFIINDADFSNDVMYFILLMIMYIYSYIIQKNSIFKYASYITANIVLLSGSQFLLKDSDFVYLIPAITTVAIMYLENLHKNLEDEASSVYLCISKCIAFVSLAGLISEIGTIITIAFAGYLLYENIKSEKNAMLNIIPLIGTMPAIFGNSFDISLQLGIMFLSVGGLSYLSIRKEEINIYTIFSGIYLIVTMANIRSSYLNVIIFICWSMIHLYYMKNAKQKDIFRFLVYTGILSLYYMVANDLRLEKYTLFSMMGIIIFAIMVIRTIIARYVKSVDKYEYITFIVLYFIALASYTNEQDGMLFILLVVGIIFISYIKKYGALFVTSILAILVNAFFLTRKFWFSVPWWVYLLVIGATLISFAIRNEANENKEKTNIGTVIKSIKDACEK